MAQPTLIQHPDGNVVKFVNWNCKGLNSLVKRNKVFHHLKYLGAHLIYLQETHLKPSTYSRARCGWIVHSFHSSYQSNSTGVAILIHKSVNFTCSKVLSDTNGRYLVLRGKLYGTPVLLVNVYAPKWDNRIFLS